jgi:uncharacterized protein YuzE
MTLRYDTETDALVVLLEDGIVARTEVVEPGTLIDLDDDGNLLTIEVLSPTRNWSLEQIIERFGIAEDNAEMLRGIRGVPVELRHSEPFALA